MQLHKFESLSDFAGVVDGMDDYARMPLFAEDAFGRITSKNIVGSQSKRINGMINTTKRHVTMAVGAEYPVFGHKQAYGLVINDLKARGINKVHGRVETEGDRTHVTLLFDDLKVIKDDKDGVELGISFKNPMDRKTSFKGSGYTWRQWCSNGAGMKTLLPQLEINERHTTTMLNSLPAIMARFIDEALNQTNHLQQLVTKSMTQKVVFESREQFEATMTLEFEGVAEKHMKGILSTLKSLEPTRWDMFNATTYYTSHSAVSLDIRDKIDDIAEKFIDVNRPINPVPMVRRVAPIVVA